MACTVNNAKEIDGSYVQCQTLNVRECLSVAGHDIGPGLTTVVTDNVTVHGDGSALDPVALKAVIHDASLSGSGTVADPLRSVGGGTTVNTDGVTIQGNGAGAPIAILAVQHDATMAGAGTVASPATVRRALGTGGIVKADDALGVVMTATGGLGAFVNTPEGPVAIVAGNLGGGSLGAGEASLVGGGIGHPGSVNIAAYGGPVQLGTGTGDVVQMTQGFCDIKALATTPGVAPAGYARFWYDSTAGVVKLSINGAPFQTVITTP